MAVDQLKLNCYVDETGQDARSSQFIVVVVIVLSDPEALRTVLREAESNSGKRQRKWTKATVAQRVAFIERLLGLSMLKGVVYYSRFPKPTNYPDSTFRAVAEALQIAANERPYLANVFIDGLTMAERQRGAEFLRSRNRRVKKCEACAMRAMSSFGWRTPSQVLFAPTSKEQPTLSICTNEPSIRE